MEDARSVISYDFIFADRPSLQFTVRLGRDTTLLPAAAPPPPQWAELEHCQCAGCGLRSADTPHCPIAVNIAGVVETFKQVPSFERCTVRCATPERTYAKDTDVQEGLFSLFGLVMATSTCPEMNWFRPLARFHLPFSTSQETVLRLAGAHFLRQYLFRQQGQEPDFSLQTLLDKYRRVQRVNQGIFARIKHVSRRDADQNAIVILNSLAQIVTMEIEDGLQSLRYLFPEV